MNEKTRQKAERIAAEAGVTLKEIKKEGRCIVPVYTNGAQDYEGPTPNGFPIAFQVRAIKENL